MEDRLVAHEFHAVLLRIDPFLFHVGEQGGQAFAGHGPAHVRHLLVCGVGAIHVGGAGALAHHVFKDGIPDVAGHVPVLRIGLGGEGADGLAVGIAVDADPRRLAAALQILGARMGVGEFHVDHARAHAPAEALSARAVGAVPRIEHEARRGRVHVQTVRQPGGEQDGFGPDRDKGGLFRADVHGERPGDAAADAGKFHHGMMVVELHADRLGLADKHLLLVGAVILQERAGLAGQGVPLAFPVSGRAHVHAPSIPHLHQLKALFQKFVHEARFLELAHEALHGFLEYGLDVVAVIGRDIAVEVIVAGRAGTAAARMALFHDDDVLASGLARRDARHEAADAAADDEEIRFDYRLDGDHDLTSLVVRVDASTCMRPYDRGMRREIAPTGQSSTQESQCQHSSGNLMRGNLSTLRSKTKRFELQISAQVPHPVHFSRSISGGIGKLLCGMFCIYRSTITAHYG